MKQLTAPQQALLSSVASLAKPSTPWRREITPREASMAMQHPDMSADRALFYVLNNQESMQ